MAPSASAPKSKGRLVALDNAKGALALLVVVGHVLLPVHDASLPVSLLYDVIYLFHMPLFVFVTDLFSKSVYREGRLRVERLLTFLLLTFSFQTLLVVPQPSLSQLATKLFSFAGAPWYLLSCVFWYLLVPVLSELRPQAGIAGAVVLALGAGCLDQLGNFLSLGRTFAFLPFFVAGYYTDPGSFSSAIQNKRALLVPSVVALGTLVLFALNQDLFKEHFYLVYGNEPYKSGFLESAAWRGIYGIVAILVSSLFLLLIPRGDGPLARLGQRTLQVYIGHRLLRRVVQDLGLYDNPLLCGATPASLAALLGMSAVFVALSLAPPVSHLIDSATSMRWHAVLKGSNPPKR